MRVRLQLPMGYPRRALGVKTSNTSLRPHLEKVHYKLYCEKRTECGWTTLLPGEISRATSSGAAVQQTQVDVYSEQTFLKTLLEFVVVDDQVCFYFYFTLSITFLHLLFLSR